MSTWPERRLPDSTIRAIRATWCAIEVETVFESATAPGAQKLFIPQGENVDNDPNLPINTFPDMFVNPDVELPINNKFCIDVRDMGKSAARMRMMLWRHLSALRILDTVTTIPATKREVGDLLNKMSSFSQRLKYSTNVGDEFYGLTERTSTILRRMLFGMKIVLLTDNDLGVNVNLQDIQFHEMDSIYFTQEEILWSEDEMFIQAIVGRYVNLRLQ